MAETSLALPCCTRHWCVTPGYLISRLGFYAARRFAERLATLGLTPRMWGALNVLDSRGRRQPAAARARGRHGPQLDGVDDRRARGQGLGAAPPPPDRPPRLRAAHHRRRPRDARAAAAGSPAALRASCWRHWTRPSARSCTTCCCASPRRDERRRRDGLQGPGTAAGERRTDPPRPGVRAAAAPGGPPAPRRYRAGPR